MKKNKKRTKSDKKLSRKAGVEINNAKTMQKANALAKSKGITLTQALIELM